MAFNKAKVLATADKYFSQQKYEKALKEYLKINKASPNETNILNKIGDLYMKTGNKQNALNYFSKAADNYRRGGFSLKAIALYKKMTRIDPEYMEARDRVVELYLHQGHQTEARAELRNMAELYIRKNLIGRAISCFEKILELDPNNLDVRLKITELLTREGRRDEAIEQYVAMGEGLINKNMIPEARKVLSNAAKYDPNNPNVKILQAKAYLAEGEMDQGIADLRALCQRFPDNLDAVKLLGETYFERNQLKEAKTWFLRAFNLSSEQRENLERIALKFLEKEDLDAAYKCLEPVVDHYLTTQEMDPAIALLRKILYVNDKHLASNRKLVSIYSAGGQVSNALLVLESIINACLDAKDTTEAVKYLRQYLELDPNNLRWRDKLDELTRGASPASSQGESPDEAANADEEPETMGEDAMVSLDDDDESYVDLDVDVDVDMEPNDLNSVIENHLTEADVFIKYGIFDRALEHLMSVVGIAPNHFDANAKLKQIYLEQDQPAKACECLLNMAGSLIEKGEHYKAVDYLDEADQVIPGSSRALRGKVEALDSQASDEAGDTFKQHNFIEDPEQSAEDAPHFDISELDASEDADVVDFSELGDSEEVSAEEEEKDQDGWSLDIPEDQVPAESEVISTPSLDFPPPKRDVSNFSLEGNEEFFDPGSDEDDDDDDELLMMMSEAGDEDSLEDVEVLDESSTAASIADLSPDEQQRLNSELDEIDFFLSMEALDDARNLIVEAIEHFGDHPSIEARQKKLKDLLEVRENAAAAPETEAPSAEASDDGDDDDAESILDKDTGFFDLAAELSEELFDESEEINDKTSSEEIQSVEELFQEFKKGVDEQIDSDDFETHYDLGIAYKEMGLLDEAISQFQRALKDPVRFLECATMIGHCMIEKGDQDGAIGHFKSCAEIDGHADDVYLALKYELGLAYEGSGELEQAQAAFKEIQAQDPDFRDVGQRIEALA